MFCLVHGSTQNASCWDLLIPKLEQRGHETVRMNLPTNEPEASATRYSDVIAEAIPAVESDAVPLLSGDVPSEVDPSENCTEPVAAAGVTPAVSVTCCPYVDDEGPENVERWCDVKSRM